MYAEGGRERSEYAQMYCGTGVQKTCSGWLLVSQRNRNMVDVIDREELVSGWELTKLGQKLGKKKGLVLFKCIT